MRCANGDGEASVAVVSPTEKYHEALCRRCVLAWSASPHKALVEQLQAEGRHGDALSQYRNWTSTRQVQLGRAA